MCVRVFVHVCALQRERQSCESVSACESALANVLKIITRSICTRRVTHRVQEFKYTIHCRALSCTEREIEREREWDSLINVA